MELTENTPAPAICLPDQYGRMHQLEDYKEKWIVIYFYPKDDTPGCTVQACGFKDMNEEYQKNSVVVLGISCDDELSHSKFIKKFDLPFTLLSDKDHQAVEDYGVWVEKNMYGKKYMGINRSTFVINPEGNIAKIYKKVQPEGHNEEVLSFIKEHEAVAA